MKKLTREDIKKYAKKDEIKVLEDIKHPTILRNAQEENIRQILDWVLELLDNPERIDDLWDEEGFPTFEATEYHNRIERALGEFRNLGKRKQ